ncbi:MAG: PTS mannose/fructose/sorbose/N-acetylgalactosamine transporter subunit IIC [Candidatus Cryosericum sp.]
MQISLWQAIAIALLYYICQSPWLGCMLTFCTVYRPLIGGTLVGIILGQPVLGMTIGATMNLLYLGFISAGGSMPGDPALAGTLGVALAIASKLTTPQALALAVPVGLIGNLVWYAGMTVNTIWLHQADKYAEAGEGRKVMFMNIVPPQIFLFIICFFPVLLAMRVGPAVIGKIMENLSGQTLHVFTVIGGMLPALGIALNLKAIAKGNAFIFFILGFFMVMYLKLDVLPVSIFMGIATVVLYNLSRTSTSKGGDTNG